MRVLHVYAGNLFGGIETYLVTLAKFASLCPEMTSEFALCFEGRLSEELKENGATIHFLGNVKIRRLWTVRRARRAMTVLLQRGNYDVVVCHSVWPQVIFGKIIQNAGLPLAFHLHNTAEGRHWLERLARRTTPDYVICNSAYTRTFIARLYPGVKNDVLHYPIGLPQKPAVKERITIRSETGVSPNTVIIVQVSRMEAWKGHKILLQALGQMRHVPDWICWIVGGAQRPTERKYEESLKSLAKSSGIGDRITFWGQQSEVPRLLQAADIFVQANTSPEPFGIVFVEALHAGLPVVTSNFGGGREIVDGSCGLCVPPSDIAGLKAALEALIGSPRFRADLGNAGPKRAHEIADPSAQLRKLHNLLKRNLCLD